MLGHKAMYTARYVYSTLCIQDMYTARYVYRLLGCTRYTHAIYTGGLALSHDCSCLSAVRARLRVLRCTLGGTYTVSQVFARVCVCVCVRDRVCV